MSVPPFQRLLFDVTSPNGVLLFREASKSMVSYGERILSISDIPPDKVYPLKYPAHRHVTVDAVPHFSCSDVLVICLNLLSDC